MIAIIDYDAGNLTSVKRALDHLGVPCSVTRDLKLIATADRIIFPGVGAAGSAMKSLARFGLDTALGQALSQGRPVLGICLGTQIIMTTSEENEATCLGLVDGRTVSFSHDMTGPGGERLKVPHMGWNNVTMRRPHPVFADILPEHQFYFVHSYHPSPEKEEDVWGTTDYGVTFASVIGRGNLVATQFHPEKSGEPGLAILRRFSRWAPS